MWHVAKNSLTISQIPRLSRFTKFPDNSRFSGFVGTLLRPPESTTQTASQSVQQSLQGSRISHCVRQTDWQTDHATRSVTTGRIYPGSTTTWLKIHPAASFRHPRAAIVLHVLPRTTLQHPFARNAAFDFMFSRQNTAYHVLRQLTWHRSPLLTGPRPFDDCCT